ncbi:DUF4199 domain-containing protein [Hymenobacter cellulosivorans]|uniref:DUF4199 domain-containing protein n=1 Tax=Hymenobacter cellulosivorans TaxID=2932249 RepID=A0ABY4F877_9BACT|nr:DUF4199 domain-containing protein [Hymenobacter cellulosivorans]UOQ52625.1 DUF4199 domain-containing protein [Hymenobacter cellulosivorans]
MEKTAPLSRPVVLRTAAICGVITALLCFLWVLFLYYTHNNPYGPKRTFSDFFPPIAAIVSQIWLRRYYDQGPGLLKAIGVGVLTTLIAAALAGVSLYMFAKNADPILIEEYLTEARQVIIAAKPLYLKQPNGLQQHAAMLKDLARTPAAFGVDEFFKKLVLGILVAIPVGVFLRK